MLGHFFSPVSVGRGTTTAYAVKLGPGEPAGRRMGASSPEGLPRYGSRVRCYNNYFSYYCGVARGRYDMWFGSIEPRTCSPRLYIL